MNEPTPLKPRRLKVSYMKPDSRNSEPILPCEGHVGTEEDDGGLGHPHCATTKQREPRGDGGHRQSER